MDAREPYTDDSRGHAGASGEITLTEIWLILLRRRFLVMAIVALCTLAGVLAALTREDTYDVSIAIEIGNVGPPGNPVPVEETMDTVAKIEESYIPQLYAESPAFLDLGLTASSPGETHLVTVGARGPAARSSEIRTVLDRLADTVIAEHERLISRQRSGVETHIEELTRQISKRNEDLRRLETERSKLQRSLATTQGRDPVPVALAHVEVERIIAGHRDALRGLETQLHRARTELVGIRSSRKISAAIVSVRPAGPGSSIIVMMAVLAGLVVATVAALCTEFVVRAGRQGRARG